MLLNLYMKMVRHYPSLGQEIRHHYILDNIPTEFTKGKFGVLLDVGCGDGSMCIRIKNKKRNYNIFGMDDGSMYNTVDSDLKFINQDLNKKFKSILNNQYDYVVCSDVLEHLEDYNFTLGEINKTLKKKGKLLITVPYLQDKEKNIKHITNGFDLIMIKKSLIENGFKIIKYKYFIDSFLFRFVKLGLGKTPILSALTFPLGWILFKIYYTLNVNITPVYNQSGIFVEAIKTNYEKNI